MVHLVNQQPLPDAGTYLVDIDIVDPITKIELALSLMNGGALTSDLPPASLVSKIELIDGGEVYWTMPGQMALAVGCYDLGAYPANFLCELANNPQYQYWYMMFGRWFNDPLYAFDPTRLRNPQLRITWARNALHLTGSLRLTVVVYTMEGVPKPTHMLAWKELDAWTSVGSGDRITEYPCDWDYEKVALRTHIITANPQNLVSNLRLSCDVGKFIPFDMSSWFFVSQMKEWFGPYHYESMVTYNNGQTRQHWGGASALIGVRNAGSNDFVGAVVSGNSFATMSCFAFGGGAGTGVSAWLEVACHMPESVFCFPFGQRNDPATWFPVGTFKSIKLITSMGLAGGTMEAAVRQARPW
jgi:hypothetical protein